MLRGIELTGTNSSKLYSLKHELNILSVNLCRVRERLSGGQSDRVTPGPMPNPEVKPVSADGTVWGTHGRAGRCQKTILKDGRERMMFPSSRGRFFFLALLPLHSSVAFGS